MSKIVQIRRTLATNFGFYFWIGATSIRAGLRCSARRTAPLLLCSVVLFTQCSAPGPVLNEPEGPVFRPGKEILFALEPLQQRYQINVAARWIVSPDGHSTIWQLSVPRDGGYRLLKYEGTAYGSPNSALVFRPKKCYIYGQNAPDDRSVPMEVWQCDHLAVQFDPSGECDSCLRAGPESGSSESESSEFLFGRLAKPLKQGIYQGKKVDAAESHTQAWYWGVFPEGMTIDTAGLPTNIKTGDRINGFVIVYSTESLPEEIRLPLRRSSSDLL
ncbi:MAG: hypothetical protein KDK33_14125 [Leptospiraceae bacterium]|nr:hypothetical protein [Leptospiraceae bacterium]